MTRFLPPKKRLPQNAKVAIGQEMSSSAVTPVWLQCGFAPWNGPRAMFHGMFIQVSVWAEISVLRAIFAIVEDLGNNICGFPLY